MIGRQRWGTRMGSVGKTIPGVMRQACPSGMAAAAVVAAVLAMSAFGCKGDDEKNTRSSDTEAANTTRLSATGGCTFNSRLSLRVFIVREADDPAQEIGRTPSAKPIVIPRCVSWFVEPEGPLDMPALTREIASKGLPGLRLRGATDGDLAHLKGLKGLWLHLSGVKITDAGLAHLEGLTGVRELYLGETKITDAGLAHLKGLTGLRELDLTGTKIRDAGLAHLKALTGLRVLSLFGTKITDAGLVHLKGLTGLRLLWLQETKITDAGLAHLKGLAGLRELDLSGTKITDAGLAHLKGLTGLRGLYLYATKITDAGADSLRKALPGARIMKER